MNELKELIELSKENPELEIVFMTYHEVCCDDSPAYWWRCQIERMSIDYMGYFDALGFTPVGKEDILYEIRNILEDSNDPEIKKLVDKNFHKLVEDRFEQYLKNGVIKKQIIVYLNI